MTRWREIFLLSEDFVPLSLPASIGFRHRLADEAASYSWIAGDVDGTAYFNL